MSIFRHNRGVRSNNLLKLASTVTVAISLSGCGTTNDWSFTHHLWQQPIHSRCRPAPDPALAIFAAKAEGDLLIAYNELNERRNFITRRSYFLQANQAQVVDRRAPHFVDASVASNMIPVRVAGPTNALNSIGWSARYPVATDEGDGFDLYRDGNKEGEYTLPAYAAGSGLGTRIALTPLALAADTVIVAVVVGVACGISYVASGGAVSMTRLHNI